MGTDAFSEKRPAGCGAGNQTGRTFARASVFASAQLIGAAEARTERNDPPELARLEEGETSGEPAPAPCAVTATTDASSRANDAK